jgi:alkylation response protein AidB-like acyl-CoA dehydrogenase
MNFELNEEHLMIRDAARDFAQKELLPGVIERDEKMEFPHKQIQQLGELGFLGMMVSPEYGGGGMDTVSYVLAMDELSRVDAAAAVVVSVQNSLVNWGLEAFGTEEQKQKYLVPLATGQVLGAFCLSEPEAGSDATQQRTEAIDMGDHYLVTGTKNWITNGGNASTYLVMAQTDREKRPPRHQLPHRGKGMEGFVVDRKNTNWASAALTPIPCSSTRSKYRKRTASVTTGSASSLP